MKTIIKNANLFDGEKEMTDRTIVIEDAPISCSGTAD